MAEARETKQQHNISVEEIWTFLRSHLSRKSASEQCKVFGIMVVGETGTGKSSLINNLLGKDLAKEGDSVESETKSIAHYKETIHDVPVVLYDTPGLSDSDPTKDSIHIKAVSTILESKEIQLVIYCQKLSETRMRRSLIHTLQEYHKIGVDWTKTVVALTFADAIPIPGKIRTKEGFDEGQYFDQKLEEWQKKVRSTLEEDVGVKQEVVQRIKICPTCALRDEELPNDDGWYVPLWLDILEILSPEAMVRFLEIQDGSVTVDLDEKQKERFVEIALSKFQTWKAKMKGVAIAVLDTAKELSSGCCIA